jgi:circadian clock protein KaiB
MSAARRFKFRLYIAGGTQNSALALINFNSLCREHLSNRYDIEIVDILREPNRALEDGIFMTPALFRVNPSPVLSIIGTLGDTPSVLSALDLDIPTA